MSLKSLSILGATGSIGCSTLEVVRETNERYKNGASEFGFEIIALTANHAQKDLIAQALEFRPKFVALAECDNANEIKGILEPQGIRVGFGKSAICEAGAMSSDMLMAAIVGAAGLEPTLEAAKRGAKILLANKECLVSAGNLFLDCVKTQGATLLPVDSEHNAIFQVLDDKSQVEKLILTASGGPFLNTPMAKLEKVSPDEACKHPNWQMGRKISVDSASLMNKGLELIEAAYLFDMPEDRIDVIVHPQSIIHSMVAYNDGSVLAQLGTPDMRIPISYCLAYPKRIAINTQRLNLLDIARLDFIAPDYERFPALKLAREALRLGGGATTILNAANEIAVAAFLDGKLPFLKIASLVANVLEKAYSGGKIGIYSSIEEILEIDNWARRIAAQEIAKNHILA